jgi:hypothetical protein
VRCKRITRMFFKNFLNIRVIRPFALHLHLRAGASVRD